MNSSLICPDLENFMTQLNDNSLESRLQLCSLFSISHQTHQTVSFCIDTLIYLQENYSSSNSPQETCFSISSDYCFIPRSYPILFDYVLDLLLQHLPPTLILLQINQQHSLSSIYPKHLFSTLSPRFLRYIYDQKLLGLLLKYIQTTTTNDRRWVTNNYKRKLDEEEKKLTDEEFIEKIIQHVSNITQWTDEQRRYAIYTYLIDERQTLLQSL
jgi:hypothetical protein